MIIIILYAADTFLLTKNSQNIFVPTPAAIIAGITALISLISYVRTPQTLLYTAAGINFTLLSITIAMLILLTGEIHSPYIALWMLVVIFSGVFGVAGLLTMFAVSNIWLLYAIITGARATPQDIFVVILATEVPLIVNFLIWHEKTNSEGKQEKTVTALTQQLTKVTNNSERIISSIADGVISMDANGAIELINPAAEKLTGWTRQNAVGIDYRSVIKLTDRRGQEIPKETSPIQQALNTCKPVFNNDLTLTTASGKQLLVSLVISPIGNKAPATGAIAVMRDITREKEEERQQAEFVSTASHEMRTPVAAIEGYLGLALNPATSYIDDKARAYLIKAHESTQHLGRLFQDLLTVSRADEGRMSTKPAVIDMSAFTKEIVESLMPKAQAKGLFLQFKPAAPQDNEKGNRTLPPLYYCFADPDQLREIISNLVDNGIKYTKQGSVTVDLTGDDKHIIISITDTGIGIPSDDIEHLFQKFYRIDNSDTREIGGTGLGLYISRRLTESNGGRIWVESVQGKGSTFYVQLPRISHEKAQGLIEGSLSPEQAQVL
jgi:PAS domain S-box-containing protein